MSPVFELRTRSIGPWTLQVLHARRASRTLVLPVFGLAGNAVANTPTGQQRTRNWKLLVGNAVQEARSGPAFRPTNEHIVTLGFSFHLRSHGNRSLDVENFVKPTLDAVAAGLFCSTPLAQLARWNHDDSGFTRFLVTRLPDASDVAGEGVALSISELPLTAS